MKHARTLREAVLAVLLAAVCTLTPLATASAHADGAYLDRIEREGPHELAVYVYSAAMDRVIEQDVLVPESGSAGRPIAYLLFGAVRAEDPVDWPTMTDLLRFAPGTGVDVVIPHGGAGTYYTDWQRDDPVLGRNRWATYLTTELPPIMDAVLHSSGRNAIVGLSMSSTSALALAEAAPQLYEAVGAFSGCAETSSPLGQAYVYLTTHVRGGGDVENMWGPFGSPAWAANDAFLHADRLRGHTLYLAAGSGLPDGHDTLTDPRIDGNAPLLLTQLTEGGVIEAATSECTRHLAARLAELGIPADYRPHPGTHSWGYWQDDLHAFWPAMAAAIGA
ncbi:esterase family protein [Nocardia yunnanensis]|uniref:Esterase family protein n=1 Tax=Nocardia yunnanensis TaxID=2382165 RepID=A0A386ZFI3_9NOCA|nr:alpha/beta hydrolase family protein [Nocardia yunnanensis]AYF76288.1 esterase family protein [Nocardia yunnanensis]